MARRATHFGQWAAQFAVASELCKRDYAVALTHGNHPTADLMVMSPRGFSFLIDVKGLRKGSTWLIRKKRPVENLFYVFAFVPSGMPNEFFVMNQATANELIRGVAPSSDIRRGDMRRYHDKWDELPT